MNWHNVRLIFLRELRDQLRDRRTLFTIAVLPILLYPLMGMSFLQVAQFSREHPTKVFVIGKEYLPTGPELLVGDRFNPKFCPSNESDLLEITNQPAFPPEFMEVVKLMVNAASSDESNSKIVGLIQKELAEKKIDLLLYVPENFSVASAIRESSELIDSNESGEVQSSDPIQGTLFEPSSQTAGKLTLLVNSASDRSRIASDRLHRIMTRWREQIIKQNLAHHQVAPALVEPFSIISQELSSDSGRRAALWSRILPFVVLVWALTGAFYPAIDLCAGEKERGTLETLLCSPAKRSEIVYGKLFTIMTFSIMTSVLNVISMGVTGLFVFKQLGQLAGGVTMGPPPLHCAFWLLIILIPVSALFSALSLAVASFARSSREGQYYLMPLLLIILPLLMLPMLPAAEIDLGSALIPVTGVMLILRALIEGQYPEVSRFVVPVIGVTLCCCFLAIRWAVNQFNNESVLFRESERFGIKNWFRHLVRERASLPTFGEAIMCGVLILVIRFFVSLNSSMPTSWNGFAKLQLITLIGIIATPALLMAVMLTRNPLKSLNLNPTRWYLYIPLAGLAAACLHPAAMGLGKLVFVLYPPPAQLETFNQQFSALLGGAPSLFWILGVMALAPAVCEELAFRGFIFTGLLTKGKPWLAVIVSSLFFGAAHPIMQQSIMAFLVGMLVGFIAVHTKNILPCIAFHFVYNSMTFLTGHVPDMAERYPFLKYIFEIGQNEAGTVVVGYHWFASVVMGLVSIGIFYLIYVLAKRAEKQADREFEYEANAAYMI
jgi:sodium transport system permease protein